MRLFAPFVSRLLHVVTTWPDRGGWLFTVWQLLWLLPVLVTLGVCGGFLSFGVTDDLRGLVTIAVIALFVPAIGEELLFRVLPIPLRHENISAAVSVIASVTAFVIWHPLQTLIFGAAAVPLFLDPWFLAAVAVLGIALARIYRATMSLWPCVAVHWIVVIGWKAFFGGPPNPFVLA